MKGVALKPIKPNYAIGAVFRIKLHTLIQLMTNDVINEITKVYEIKEDRITKIVGDAAPSAILNAIIEARIKKWRIFFKKIAPAMVVQHVDDVDNSVKRDLFGSIAVSNFPPEIIQQFKVSMNKDSIRSLDAKEALIRSNVDLISNIPDEFKQDIFGDVMDSAARGRDIKYLTEKLRKTGQFTDKRAALIARDQMNKATGIINAARQADLGIKKNVWYHSHGDKVPRKSHLAANGRIYNLDEGCPIDGEYIYPGEKINCTCFSGPYFEFENV